ncbi:hypothetical protein ACFO3J_17660 [Streptomyces polygonati]|uniref:Uncharacterized protein n=1 Tax=Streptomyces polygonati TaxID=1617087 RepID=A0ABV8HQU7_9ACTN
MAEEDVVGLNLFPDDGDITSADISWSYNGFGDFRRWLALAEGFDLSGMIGFGGQRPWSDVDTTLAPFLDHPDDEGDLSPVQCAAILPRLEEIARHRNGSGNDPILQRRIQTVDQLVVVLRLCVEKDVDLLFG